MDITEAENCFWIFTIYAIRDDQIAKKRVRNALLDPGTILDLDKRDTNSVPTRQRSMALKDGQRQHHRQKMQE